LHKVKENKTYLLIGDLNRDIGYLVVAEIKLL